MKECVEIYAENPNENRDNLFITFYRNGVSRNQLCLTEIQRKAGEWENLRKKEKASGILFLETVGRGKLEVGWDN